MNTARIFDRHALVSSDSLSSAQRGTVRSMHTLSSFRSSKLRTTLVSGVERSMAARKGRDPRSQCSLRREGLYQSFLRTAGEVGSPPHMFDLCTARILTISIDVNSCHLIFTIGLLLPDRLKYIHKWTWQIKVEGYPEGPAAFGWDHIGRQPMQQFRSTCEFRQCLRAQALNPEHPSFP